MGIHTHTDSNTGLATVAFFLMCAKCLAMTDDQPSETEAVCFAHDSGWEVFESTIAEGHYYWLCPDCRKRCGL